MKRAFALLLAVVLLTSCGSEPEKKNVTGGDTPPMKNVTDKTKCTGTPSPGASIYKEWAAEFVTEDNKLHYWVTFDFNHGTLTATNSCWFEGQQAQVEIEVLTQIVGKEIRILENDSKMVKQGNLQCGIQFKKDTTMEYKLVGSCLELDYNGSKELFLEQ